MGLGNQLRKSLRQLELFRGRQQPVFQEFWREGVRRNKDFESIFTMGLRAENDSGAPIGQGLTGEIVNVERKILAEEVNPDLTQVPQLWCLYKEVQDYYNDGLRVPEDVTLLWAEDNWGDVRRLPTAEERRRRRRRGNLLSFRLPRRPAQLPVDQYQPYCEDLGSDVAGEGNMERTASGLSMWGISKVMNCRWNIF